MAGIADLQNRGEFIILKGAGLSIWRILRGPVLFVTLAAAVVSIGGESGLILLDRSLPGRATNSRPDVWLEQNSGTRHYIINAKEGRITEPQLSDLQVFETDGERARIVADQATLRPGFWLVEHGQRLVAGATAAPFDSLEVPTDMTVGDLRLAVTSGSDLTLPELAAILGYRVSGGQLKSVALTSLFRTFSLPLTVAGAMLIGFAFMSRYRRRRDYQVVVTYGILIGFALFVLNELSIRAGNSQVIPPEAAAFLPAIVALICGTTALLMLEDGQT